MTAQFSGPGIRAEKVAMESVDWIRLSRAPRMKYRRLLSMAKALEYFRRSAKQTDNSPVRAVANEREFFF